LKHRIVRAVGLTAAAAAIVLGTLSAQPPILAAPSPAGYRAASPEYGLSIFLYGNPATTDRDLAKIQALGFGWQKSLFRWRDIEAAGKGQFDWAESDRVVQASTAAGMKIIARLDFPPSWARADGANNGAPDNYQDFADFVRAFVDRYKAGSPNGTVQAIEVWNEVNLQREWGSPISPQSAAGYVRLLKLAYQAAKAADPTVTVISAGLSPTGWSDDTAQPDDQFMQWLFDAGMKGSYDVLGGNGNVQCPSVDAQPGACPVMADRMAHPSFYFRRIEQLRDIMVAAGDADKQIWLMEFGWTTDTVNPSYSWYATTEAKKADLIVQAFQFANKSWSPWIGVMTLWTLADPHWGQSDEQTWWSVTNPDGTTRPAYDRLVQAIAANQLPMVTPPVAAPTAKPTAKSAAKPTEAPATPVAGAGPAAPPPATAPSPEMLRVSGTDGDGLSLRDAPSAIATRLKTLPEGTVVRATGDPRQADGLTWRNVSDPNGNQGWVVGDYLTPA
jgi:hypothetical protein